MTDTYKSLYLRSDCSPGLWTPILSSLLDIHTASYYHGQNITLDVLPSTCSSCNPPSQVMAPSCIQLLWGLMSFFSPSLHFQVVKKSYQHASQVSSCLTASTAAKALSHHLLSLEDKKNRCSVVGGMPGSGSATCQLHNLGFISHL